MLAMESWKLLDFDIVGFVFEWFRCGCCWFYDSSFLLSSIKKPEKTIQYTKGHSRFVKDHRGTEMEAFWSDNLVRVQPLAVHSSPDIQTSLSAVRNLSKECPGENRNGS